MRMTTKPPSSVHILIVPSESPALPASSWQQQVALHVKQQGSTFAAVISIPDMHEQPQPLQHYDPAVRIKSLHDPNCTCVNMWSVRVCVCVCACVYVLVCYLQKIPYHLYQSYPPSSATVPRSGCIYHRCSRQTTLSGWSYVDAWSPTGSIMCHFLAGKAETVITLDGSLGLIVSHSNDDVFLTSDMLLNTACVSSGPLSLFLSNSLRWAMIRLLNTDCFIDLLINWVCNDLLFILFHRKVCPSTLNLQEVSLTMNTGITRTRTRTRARLWVHGFVW